MILRKRIQTTPAPSKPEWMQEKINATAGLNQYGQPLILLEWGGTATKHDSYGVRAKYPVPLSTPDVRQVGWHEARRDGSEVNHPVSAAVPKVRPDSLLVPRYESFSLADPCWYLAEWVPATKFGTPEHWQSLRFKPDAEGHIIDLLGEYPSNGRYEALLRLVDLDTGETLRADDTRILEIVQRIVSVRDAQPTLRHWQEEMTEAEKAAGVRDMWDSYLAEQKRREDDLRERIADRIAPMANKLLNIPRVFVHQP